ncbi:MAG: nickel pincer cofactor biosynthesis protein LarC [Candidatus Heimdallarchaeaceae archaeon]
MTKALIIDPRIAGCSGDMFLSSLIDLIGNNQQIEHLKTVINSQLSTRFSIEYKKLKKKGIMSTSLGITIDKDIEQKNIPEIRELFDKVKNNLELSEKGKNLADEILNSLFEAESKVHGKELEKLHLHEAASLDTILDILGTVYILEKNELLDLPIFGLPVNVGSGFITFSHGKVSVPPPAVTEILQSSKYVFFSDNTEGELLTPTGVAILVNIVSKQITSLPPIRINKIGYGAGTKDLPDQANVLKILLVDLEEDIEKHYISMLETHLDDVSGEILGGLVSKLMEEGALDVAYYPLIMKKNRPSWCLRVICEEKDAPNLALFIMKESGTLGVRENRYSRYELKRRIVERSFFINEKIFSCRFKERLVNNQVIGVKPEYEDTVKISESTKIPLIELEQKLINLYYMEEENCE